MVSLSWNLCVQRKNKRVYDAQTGKNANTDSDIAMLCHLYKIVYILCLSVALSKSIHTNPIPDQLFGPLFGAL